MICTCIYGILVIDGYLSSRGYSTFIHKVSGILVSWASLFLGENVLILLILGNIL